jgi:beta-galactosidase/beta-glucuronidase
VDDTPHPFKLEGKQGYGKARGLWQTVYLEARPALYVESFEFHPSVGLKRVELRVRLSEPAPAGATLELRVPAGPVGDPSFAEARQAVEAGAREARLTLPLGASPRLWSLADPHLYEATLTLGTASGQDRVMGYFGLREIGVAKLPGLGHPYVALNGTPVYLQPTGSACW